MESIDGHDPLILELLVKPPALLPPNTHLRLPVLVAVKSPHVKENGVGPRQTGDMSGVWALVSLLTADGSEVIVPPRTGLLTGRTVASIHAPSAQAEPNREIVGYAHFSDLTITTPGQYRLRISLIDMDSNGPSYTGSTGGGRNIYSISSDVITVDSGAILGEPCKF